MSLNFVVFFLSFLFGQQYSSPRERSTFSKSCCDPELMPMAFLKLYINNSLNYKIRLHLAYMKTINYIDPTTRK